MKKLMILSSVSLLTAIMSTSVWAEQETESTTATKTEAAVAAPEAPSAPDAPIAPEAPTAEADKAENAASKTEDKAEEATSTEKVAETPAEKTPELYIISPKEGEEVSSPVTIIFGLKGMGVAPAGVEKDNTGHHHLLVDQAELPPEGVPMGANVQHFGGGQTQAEVELSAGEHSLQLILGDMAHVPLSPVLSSEKITINVK